MNWTRLDGAWLTCLGAVLDAFASHCGPGQTLAGNMMVNVSMRFDGPHVPGTCPLTVPAGRLL